MPAAHQYRNLSKHTDTRQASQQSCTRPTRCCELCGFRPGVLFTPAAAYARRQTACKPSHLLAAPGPESTIYDAAMVYFSLRAHDQKLAGSRVFSSGTDLTTLAALVLADLG